MTLDDLVSGVTEEKLRAGKVLIYNPGRHAPIKVSIWWRQLQGFAEGTGMFGVNVVSSAHKNRPWGEPNKTYVYGDNFEAAKVGFKSACERAIALWAQKTMQPHKVH